MWAFCSYDDNSTKYESNDRTFERKSTAYDEATEEHGVKCKDCGYVIKDALPHIHKNNVQKVSKKNSIGFDRGNIEYYICSCGVWFFDAKCTIVIGDKLSVLKPYKIGDSDADLFHCEALGDILLSKDGKFIFNFFDEDLKQNKEITSTYSISGNVYCFNLSKTKYEYIYGIKDSLQNNKINHYQPVCEVNCLFFDNNEFAVLTFYENYYVVAKIGDESLTFYYSIDDKGGILSVNSTQFISEILGLNREINFKNPHWKLGGNT